MSAKYKAHRASRGEIRASVAPLSALCAASPFVTRLRSWPRGYAGDFETIDYLLRQTNRAPQGTLAHYGLTSPIAQQHRNKVAWQAANIHEAIQPSNRSAPAREPRVLVISCGASPDVLGNVYRCWPRPASLGSFDLIVAGGLFDYLPDRQAQTLLGVATRRLLHPGGRFLFTNIASATLFRPWIEYWADWHLIERSEADIRARTQAVGLDGPDPEPAWQADFAAATRFAREQARKATSEQRLD